MKCPLPHFQTVANGSWHVRFVDCFSYPSAEAVVYSGGYMQFKLKGLAMPRLVAIFMAGIG
jgi:hypothetical protein